MKILPSALGLLLVAFLSPMPLFAQEAKTVPVGIVSITAAGAVAGAPKVTSISLPLVNPAVITGQASGRITGVTANSISNSNANWTASQLSQVATPFVMRITSGSASGRTFLLSTATPNTSSTVFLDPEEANLVNLASLGIVTGANGDTYEILQCDTISEFFGTPATTGVVGGTSQANADVVGLMVAGTWRYYFFSNNSGSWIQIGTNTPSNNVPIRPDAAVTYTRISASPLNIALVGRIPHLQRQATIANSGRTYLSNGWPKDMTLGTSNIQSIPGWVTSADPNVADCVSIFVFGAWRTYQHNGIQWVRSGVNAPSNDIPISSTSGVVILKRGAAPGSAALTQAPPYTL